MGLLVTVLSVLLIISVIFGYIQYKARVKNQKIIYEMIIKMDKALQIMRKVDKTGAFESHDVVGQTFVLLVTAIEQLRNYFVGIVGNDENDQKKE